jgi:release factor glutamine methyltransferase
MRYNVRVTIAISARARAEATHRLRAAGCVFAEEEAAALSAAAVDEETLCGLVSRRAAGEPLEQVVGYADFCGLRIRLRPGVFVPRVRSELLVRLAADAAHRVTDPIVVDMCCGSGALGAAVSRLVPRASLHACDVSAAAVACARDNLADDGAQVHLGDLFTALPATLRGRIDVLVANVPYVPTGHLALLPAEARLHEPRTARWLAGTGVVLSEITRAQVPAATAALRAAGLHPAIDEDDEYEAVVVRGHGSDRPAGS